MCCANGKSNKKQIFKMVVKKFKNYLIPILLIRNLNYIFNKSCLRIQTKMLTISHNPKCGSFLSQKVVHIVNSKFQIQNNFGEKCCKIKGGTVVINFLLVKLERTPNTKFDIIPVKNVNKIPNIGELYGNNT